MLLPIKAPCTGQTGSRKNTNAPEARNAIVNSGCPATEDENIPLFAWERVNPSTSMAAAAAVN